MKVLFRGQPEAEKRYQVKCSSCRSILEYSHIEVLKVYNNQRDGETHELGSCPVCTKALYNYTPSPLKVNDMWHDEPPLWR